MSQIAILGRQPAIGIAELESLYGPEVLTPIGDQAVRIEMEQSAVQPGRLGGTIKLGKVLTTLETTKWTDIRNYLKTTLPDHLVYIPEGKIKLGLSAYGIDTTPNDINATALELKKVIKRANRSSRIISNKSLDLNSAQVLHGGLLSSTGVELLLVADKSNTIIAQTHWVQDIDAYRRRDQERPKRDTRVGMLPPKLAQTIINLATSNSKLGNSELPIPNSQFPITVVDPFCGTGVILQEALLMGYLCAGADLEPRMIEYTGENLNWLSSRYDIQNSSYDLLVADATSHSWFTGSSLKAQCSVLATETYLGRPLSSPPDQDTLRKIMSDCDTIHRKFLKNAARQTKSGFRMCIAVPAWHTRSGFKHLKTLASLEELGYNRHKFVHADNKDLIYHRPGQIVARELVVLTRK